MVQPSILDVVRNYLRAVNQSGIRASSPIIEMARREGEVIISDPKAG